MMSAQSYLLRGGQVYTMDPGRPWAQCVVVRGKMITYVGPEAGAVSFTDSGTEVIEVDGGMVLPGFIDAHNHLAGSGAMAKLGVELNGLSDPAEMVARIRGYAASHPGPVIRGSGAALGAFTVEGIRDAQELTLVPAPSWGITGYLEAGILLGANQNSEPVYEDLVERDNAGQLPVRQMTFPPDHIERQIELTQLAGFDSHIHIDADGSARVVLDAIEAVQRRHGRGTARHTVCHNTIVHPADVKRFAELGVIANCTPLWGTDYDGSFYDTYLAKLGAERMEERLYPYGDLVRSGALVTYGSDIPGVLISEIAPLTQIEAAVTRKRPGFPDDRALVPRQRIDLHDALRGYTINGAYQLRLDDIAGSLEAGKHADLTVLAENLFGVAPEEIHSVPVKLTMMDGRITHDTR
jgi:predicted amidohydrolase YtcJ